MALSVEDFGWFGSAILLRVPRVLFKTWQAITSALRIF